MPYKPRKGPAYPFAGYGKKTNARLMAQRAAYNRMVALRRLAARRAIAKRGPYKYKRRY